MTFKRLKHSSLSKFKKITTNLREM